MTSRCNRITIELEPECNEQDGFSSKHKKIHHEWVLELGIMHCDNTLLTSLWHVDVLIHKLAQYSSHRAGCDHTNHDKADKYGVRTRWCNRLILGVI